MLFSFLKYLQPIDYFNLRRNSGDLIFPKPSSLPIQFKSRLHSTDQYISDIAKDYDLSWQAINSGYIGDAETFQGVESIELYDNYCFIRRYFHPVWVFYVLCIRICLFNNPIREFSTWKRSSRVKRIKLPIVPWRGNTIKKDVSKSIIDGQFVSVIIPTLNRYKFLQKVLNDFEKQDFKNFEIIIVDQSDDFDLAFYKQFDLNITCYHQEEKALWKARNFAISKARASLIALSEDDVRIPFDWLSNHLRCLEGFKADISAGVFFPEGSTIPFEKSFYATARQFATGNALLKKEVFIKVGLFDRQFEGQRMGDAEFGLRAYKSSFLSVSNPLAYCLDVKAEVGGLREMGSWDAYRPSKIWKPRPLPSVLYYYRQNFGKLPALYALLKTVPLSLFSYKHKRNKSFVLMSGLLSLLLLPFVLIQVIRSWHLSNAKLEQGPLIETLDVNE